jgi:hypothetical protein
MAFRSRIPLLSLVSVLAVAGIVCAETTVPLPELRSSPLNGRALDREAGASGYSVILIGHAYGNFDNSNSKRPAASLLANIDKINEIGPSFVAVLGDIVRAPRAPYTTEFRDSFANALTTPVFAVPGEHDLFEGTENYERVFGPSYHRIEMGRELFVFLDTGGASRSTEISPAQLSFVEASLSRAAESASIENVVVLMHKVIWVRLPRYQSLRELVNNDRKGRFWSRIHPSLRALAGSKRVFVGAGDIGHKSYSFFHDVNPKDGITYFATGLADRASDTIVRMDFTRDGDVAIRAVSLTQEPVLESAATLGGFAKWRGGR